MRFSTSAVLISPSFLVWLADLTARGPGRERARSGESARTYLLSAAKHCAAARTVAWLVAMLAAASSALCSLTGCASYGLIAADTAVVTDAFSRPVKHRSNWWTGRPWAPG